MWTADDEPEGAAAAAVVARERSAREVAMRDGTRNENATRLCGAIEMDVNEDSVAPWNRDVAVDDDDNDGGCAAAAEDDVDGGGGADVGVGLFGMNEVTTATGCAVSRRSARILWERSRACVLVVR